ncbi:hypothetical protein RoseRS_2647 [Roseiflexus sp. RS-1]|nr:hypothetical protein RoseRS_2647 [Roseiflexus sp. RS-1]
MLNGRAPISCDYSMPGACTERKIRMETGLEFVANARRQLIRLIALTIVASSCAALLLIAILMIITGNVVGLASYAGVVVLGLAGSLATLALLKRRVL